MAVKAEREEQLVC